MEAHAWIDSNLKLVERNEASFLYEGMDSQSGRSLPLIYEPFDADLQSHWADRGAAFDFVATTGGGRLLDFGPGDGWPSLIVAPYVDEVIGVDASPGLVEVCRANADALEIENASFREIPSDGRLPFDDESFDGVMASSSLEQTADPRATLGEFLRVLRPGGRLRMYYEALGAYRGGQEQQGWLMERDDGTSFLFLSQFLVDEERARHVRLHLDVAADVVAGHLGTARGRLDPTRVTVDALTDLRDHICSARSCWLTHASGRTLVGWMRELGFATAKGTHAGRKFAAALYESIPAARRPGDLAGVDALVRPAVEEAVWLAAPIGNDPMITAVK